jgi:hypothetical protein
VHLETGEDLRKESKLGLLGNVVDAAAHRHAWTQEGRSDRPTSTGVEIELAIIAVQAICAPKHVIVKYATSTVSSA